MLPGGLDLAAFEGARARIAGRVSLTPMQRLESGPWLKLECMQVTGSFKPRGALNRVLSLPPERVARGIVTASGGNHGLAVAFVGHALGVPATVYLPESAPAAKAAGIERWGGAVIRAGEVWDDAHAAALAAAERDGTTYVHPFADPEVVAGQGTLALEIVEQLPDVDLLVVAIGGGGLIAGVAAAARLLRPGIRVVGVEPVGAPTLHESLRQGRVVELASITTKASTLAPRRSDPYVFEIIREVVDEIVLVTDEEMKSAARLLFENAQVGVELSGAAALAAFQKGGPLFADAKRPCVLVCGAGTDGETAG